MKKISFYLPTEILGICDRNLERANVRSRNQFLVKAVKFYEGYLNKEDITDILTRSSKPYGMQNITHDIQTCC